MSKLTLNLESLDVQSFEMDAQQARTVFKPGSTNTTPACCYTFGCGDSIKEAC